jgi:hypothetical protein
MRDGCVVFATQSVRSNLRQAARRAYAGEVDVFVVHCNETGGLYAVPVQDAPAGGEMRLRVSPAANGQRVGIRWAAQYQLPA